MNQPCPALMPGWMRDVAAALPSIRASQLTRFTPPDGSEPRPAAVLVLFGEGEGGPELVLLRRAADLRKHPGQVAFPGGSTDPDDADAVAAALREAREETGIDPAGVEVVGTLPPLWLPVSDFMVTPVVGWWRVRSALEAVDANETHAVFTIPVAALLDRENRGSVRHPSGYVGPAFLVDGILVWGFTAGIIARLFGLLGWEREWDPERTFDLPHEVAR